MAEESAAFGGARARQAYQVDRRNLRPPACPRPHPALGGADGLAQLAPGATVTDDGRAYRGPDAVRGWLGQTASEYTYTTTPAGATHEGSGRCTVTQHLEGDFPGGSVDLRYHFTLDANGLIGELAIAP